MTRTCAACGAPARAPFQAPPAELSPDLDLRPGEPTRSTLSRWIMTCPRCGSSAPDLGHLPGRARETIETPAYQKLAGSEAERPFLRYALLCEAAGEREEAAAAVLQAAWLMDDLGDQAETDAAALRRRAASLYGEPATVQDGLRLLDILRRAGDTAGAESHAARLMANPTLAETDRAVVAYQQRLIAARDTGRHLLSSALRPPSHRPHATHGRPPARSFWQRLAGR